MNKDGVRQTIFDDVVYMLTHSARDAFERKMPQALALCVRELRPLVKLDDIVAGESTAKTVDGTDLLERLLQQKGCNCEHS